MDEIYWQAFKVENGLAVPHPDTPEARLNAPEQLLFPVPADDETVTVAVGSGWQYGARIAAQGQQVVDDNLLPRASAIARLAELAQARGELLRADQVAPSYVRNEIAWKKIDQQ
jgi:tRNA threonylcarbamoyladenosine biosynthesis protein TsaB